MDVAYYARQVLARKAWLTIGREDQPETYARAKGALDVTEREEAIQQCHLLRDIFGNPFCAVAVDRTWLAWNDSTAMRIAQAIYDECAFDRLPILADALEDAGCDNADILNHCRQPGEHVRGCWVIDLLLGKE